MGHDAAPSPVVRLFAAIGLALIGTTLAVFVFPQMRRSDAFLRDGVRAAATIVKIDDATCFDPTRKVGWPSRSKGYPCFKATGEWTHDGVTYRAPVSHSKQRDARPVGSTLTVVFAPDPAAAAGKAGLRFRAATVGNIEPVSERPIYLGLLALASLMWVPLVRTVLQKLST